MNLKSLTETTIIPNIINVIEIASLFDKLSPKIIMPIAMMKIGLAAFISCALAIPMIFTL